jgi:hypothetical protein
MGPTPNRRLEWIVRLVFYPAAITLIALAWHERQASADDGGQPVTAPAPWRVTRTFYTGSTGQGMEMTGQTVDGRPGELSMALRFTCRPWVGDVWATYVRQSADRPRDLASSFALRLRHYGIATTWPSGWRGTTDLAVDLDATSSGAGLRGRMSADLRLVSPIGRRARCHTGPVTFALRP